MVKEIGVIIFPVWEDGLVKILEETFSIHKNYCKYYVGYF